MKIHEKKPQFKQALLNRLMLVLLVSLIWLVAILARLVYLQGFKAENYQAEAASQQRGYVEVNASRGNIVDRNLEELAISVPVESVYSHPTQIKEPLKVAQGLSQILEMAPEPILEKFNSGSAFAYLKRKISPRQASQIRQMELPGVLIQDESKRAYPNRELACHVLGFVGVDDGGLGGLEYHYNKELSGQKTRVHLRLDARRKCFHRTQPKRRYGGNLLVLTLDREIQYIAETVLRQTVESHQAAGGSAIVLDPYTGEVLAMASCPIFNPNNYQDSPAPFRRNRAILNLYEPGSTFKIITLAAVLNERLAAPEEILDCRVGTARLAGKVYKEAKRSFGDLSVAEVLSNSSNVGTVKLGLRLGEEKLYEYVERFGFGKRTGIDLPGEEPGLVRPTSQWSKVSIGAISIGQELAVTPLQMTRAVAAIANGGYLVSTNVVKKIRSPNGDLLYEPTATRDQILTKPAAQQIKQLMKQVVSSGTGRTSQLSGYSSAGKTGTAQKIVDGVYSKEKYVASFAGFAPVDEPVLAALIVIDEPGGIPYGGHVAGPAFKDLMERSLIHLRIAKDQPVPLEETIAQSSPSSSPGSARSCIQNSEGSFTMQGLQETVLSIRGDAPEDQAPRGRFTVNLSNRALPDFTGLTLRQAARSAAQLGVRLKIHGSGVAIAQRPSPGNRVSKQMVCEVFFSTQGQKPDASIEAAIRDIGPFTGTFPD